MSTFDENKNIAGANRLSKLQKAIVDDPEDQAALQEYFQEAIGAGEADHAQRVLENLQRQQPWNHHVRRLGIALCLHLADYPGAMDAIEVLVAFSEPDDALIDTALAVRNKHLGPRTINDLAQTGSSISVCMIVKDEQPFMGPCLNSVKSLADEIIVVNTGSTDRTGDIARIYGARVYNFEWRDDFSAARNESLQKANGDWILILDADEIIAPQDHAVIRRMVNSGGQNPKAYSFRTRNYSNLANAVDWQANDRSYPLQETGMGWFPSDKIRLFPRRPIIRFEYPVHELVDPSVEKAGLDRKICEIPIHHYGHLNEARNRKKAQHYFKLGYQKLDQLGGNKVALRELAIQAGQLEHWLEAIELWDRFLLLCPDHGEAFANMAGAYWQMGHYEKGIRYSRMAIQADPGLKEGHYNLAVNMLMAGRPEKAANILQTILREHQHYTGAFFMLAAARRIMGDQKSSRSIYNLLKEELSDRVLTIACRDLARKFNDSGLPHFADMIERAMV